MKPNKAYLSPERTKYIRSLNRELSDYKVNSEQWIVINSKINKFWVEEILRNAA